MVSKRVQNRLKAMVNALVAKHEGGGNLSSHLKGQERELFVKEVLENIISRPFRIGSGDIVDRNDISSGHVDVVIEFANTLSFPLHTDSERLYLAESICAVIEIKSNLSDQWSEVEEKAHKLFRLERELGAEGFVGRAPPTKIPMFVVGYEGWQNAETVQRRLVEINTREILVAGILQLSPCYYVTSLDYPHGYLDERGLFGLFLSIEQLTSSLLASKPFFKAYVE
jgi:hypothetical protein